MTRATQTSGEANIAQIAAGYESSLALTGMQAVSSMTARAEWFLSSRRCTAGCWRQYRRTAWHRRRRRQTHVCCCSAARGNCDEWRPISANGRRYECTHHKDWPFVDVRQFGEDCPLSACAPSLKLKDQEYAQAMHGEKIDRVMRARLVEAEAFDNAKIVDFRCAGSASLALTG